jgi:hypothetical protein
MAERPKKKSQPAEHTTARPPFDPEVFAKESDTAITGRRPEIDSDMPTNPRANVGRLLANLAPAAGQISLEQVPFVVMAREDVAWFGLDDRAAELLSRINGTTTVQGLLASGEFIVTDAFRILGDLARDGIIAFR